MYHARNQKDHHSLSGWILFLKQLQLCNLCIQLLVFHCCCYQLLIKFIIIIDIVDWWRISINIYLIIDWQRTQIHNFFLTNSVPCSSTLFSLHWSIVFFLSNSPRTTWFMAPASWEEYLPLWLFFRICKGLWSLPKSLVGLPLLLPSMVNTSCLSWSSILCNTNISRFWLNIGTLNHLVVITKIGIDFGFYCRLM